MSAAMRANALEAVERDPVRRLIEAGRAELGNRRFRAMMLSPTVETCAALLRGELVPLDRLDCKWVQKFGLRNER